MNSGWFRVGMRTLTRRGEVREAHWITNADAVRVRSLCGFEGRRMFPGLAPRCEECERLRADAAGVGGGGLWVDTKELAAASRALGRQSSPTL